MAYEGDPPPADDAATQRDQQALLDKINAMLGLAPAPAVDPQLMAQLRGYPAPATASTATDGGSDGGADGGAGGGAGAGYGYNRAMPIPWQWWQGDDPGGFALGPEQLQYRYAPTNPGFHEYPVKNELCPPGIDCTKERALEALREYSVPGNRQPITENGTYRVRDPFLGISPGDVDTFISPDGMTATNKTRPNHWFHDGMVVRQLVPNENGNGYAIKTYGFGENTGGPINRAFDDPTLGPVLRAGLAGLMGPAYSLAPDHTDVMSVINRMFGTATFEAMDRQARKALYDRYGPPADPQPGIPW